MGKLVRRLRRGRPADEPLTREEVVKIVVQVLGALFALLAAMLKVVESLS